MAIVNDADVGHRTNSYDDNMLKSSFDRSPNYRKLKSEAADYYAEIEKQEQKLNRLRRKNLDDLSNIELEQHKRILADYEKKLATMKSEQESVFKELEALQKQITVTVFKNLGAAAQDSLIRAGKVPESVAKDAKKNTADSKYAASSAIYGMLGKVGDSKAGKAGSAILKPVINAIASVKNTQEITAQRELEAQENYEDAIRDGNEASISVAKEHLQAAMLANNLAKASVNTLNYIKNQSTRALNDIDKELDTLASYSKGINTRLQGTDTTLSDILNNISGNIGTSPFFKQTEVLSKISEMVNKGISYNVEWRGFLSSAADKVANTFDANSDSLFKLIRLQQADTTSARLGMEAKLTQFFNQMYQNTEYLQQSFDSVQQSLENVLSTMTSSQGAEFEFVVQKWLGSLYSLGFENASSIAQGLNFLGTGDVNSLNSNNAMQTLLAMSANRAGLDYSSMLLNGLTASDTNELLKSMVEYLQEIAEGDNNVVKSAYGSILGLNLSDLRAIRNITASDISSIYGTALSYDDMEKELVTQLGMAKSRTSFAEQMSNVYDNLITSLSTGIVENPALYGMWKLNNLVEDASGGINIPFVSAFGTGVDINANVNQLIKLGLIGAGVISNVGKFASSQTSGGYANASNWGDYSAVLSRGQGFQGITTGSALGTSEITTVTSSSSSDITSSTLSDSADSATTTSEIVNKNTKNEYDTSDIYKELFVRKKLPINAYIQEYSRSAEDQLSNSVYRGLRFWIDDYTSNDSFPVRLNGVEDDGIVKVAIAPKEGYNKIKSIENAIKVKPDSGSLFKVSGTVDVSNKEFKVHVSNSSIKVTGSVDSKITNASDIKSTFNMPDVQNVKITSCPTPIPVNIGHVVTTAISGTVNTSVTNTVKVSGLTAQINGDVKMSSDVVRDGVLAAFNVNKGDTIKAYDARSSSFKIYNDDLKNINKVVGSFETTAYKRDKEININTEATLADFLQQSKYGQSEFTGTDFNSSGKFIPKTNW